MMKDSNMTTNFNGMTREEKDLVLHDLCARLPYGVKVLCKGWDDEKGEVDIPLTVYSINTDGYVYFESNDYDVDYSSIEECKPYLRPMSSMTEEEKKELKFMCDIGPETLTDSSWINGEFGLGVVYKNKASICVDAIDWLNKNMFDFRGLIPKDLALSTEEYNPYVED